ncbi:hypothetical protein M407DRAFT_244400 [Tulasnella calospora MUT 4182]|uniref:Uncharacterized protein n=1 Tax=Tulasnella calospora MUT 4182 TaxID=1051891 RepID=A0A0C3QGD4_9AGAM|nr:hypothetical protein M407DRAFT_244400 [Tulasnella calospora MUT 4182]
MSRDLGSMFAYFGYDGLVTTPYIFGITTCTLWAILSLQLHCRLERSSEQTRKSAWG